MGVVEPILLDLPEELRGPRVLLRPYRAGDGAAIWEAIEESRTHLAPWMPWLSDQRCREDSEVFARRALARWHLREDLILGIWERGTGRYLGSTGLHVCSWSLPSFAIGYWIRRSAERRGFVREAVAVLCRFGFDDLGAVRIEIRCDRENERSARVARGLGFTLEACLRNQFLGVEGDVRDVLLFRLTPEEYRACCAAWPERE